MGLALGLALLGCRSTGLDRDLWQVPDHFPDFDVPWDNPMSEEKVTLGHFLFYDVRLSLEGDRSCGICHEQAKGFTDGFVRSIGTTGELVSINSLSLTDVAWREQLGWRTPELTSLEEQLLIPLLAEHPVEMGMTEALVIERLEGVELYESGFAAAFPDALDPITLDNVGYALSAYQRTLISGRSDYDLYLLEGTSMGAAADRGLALFESSELGCTSCHGGLFLDEPVGDGAGERHGYYNTGLYDVDGAGSYPEAEQGLIAQTGRAEDMGRFRTPSLRNVALTGPYNHDGTTASLSDLVDNYARGGRNVESGALPGDGAFNPHKDPRIAGFELGEGDKGDLLAFLDALTDWDMVQHQRFATPFCVEEDEVVINEPCELPWEIEG